MEPLLTAEQFAATKAAIAEFGARDGVGEVRALRTLRLSCFLALPLTAIRFVFVAFAIIART